MSHQSLVFQLMCKLKDQGLLMSCCVLHAFKSLLLVCYPDLLVFQSSAVCVCVCDCFLCLCACYINSTQANVNTYVIAWDLCGWSI